MVLKTLGGLKLEGGDFTQGRPLLLLAYLCVEGAQERRHVAELFWPRSNNAVRNLTTVLSRLNKVDSDVIEMDGHKLRATLECDANQLKSAFEQQDYQSVLVQYQGRFLDGFHLKDMGEELEEWLYKIREKLADCVRTALIHTAQKHAQQTNHAQAAELAAQAYHLHGASEPDEVILEQLHVLLSAAGHALSKDVQREAATFGVTLDASQALHVQSQIETLKELPSFPTAFVGREQEVEQLCEQLEQTNTRLLSIIAQGGMGKTRLAVEVGRKLSEDSEHFPDGVVFISFVSVTDPEAMIITIGEALGLSFSGQVEPRTQVFNYLRDKRLLLILDNLEQLLSGVELLAELLQHAPRICLLVTSREALRLSAEHVYELGGLITPGEATSDAVTLFVARAKMQQPHFTLDETTTPLVITICQLVAGMPLALELAASWLRALPLEDIAQEITSGIDLLVSHSRDVPERQRSIRVIFDTSWALLDEAEQTAMRKLAVFTGGFHREAASEVAGVSLLTLASLIDKSLLSMTNHKRYRRHPLVIQYAQEKAQEHLEEKGRIEEKHGLYFLNLVQSIAPKLVTLERKAIMETLAPDFPNIKAAWSWAIQEKKLDEMVASSEALSIVFFDHMLDVERLFDQAVLGLDESNPEHHKALGYALVFQAKVSRFLLLNRHYEQLARKGAALLKPLGDVQGLVYGMTFASTPDVDSVSTAEKLATLQEALDLARQYGSSTSIGDILMEILFHKRNAGESESTMQAYEDAMLEMQKLGNVERLAGLEFNFGGYLNTCNKPQRARTLLEQSLVHYQQLGIEASQLHRIYQELGYAALRSKDYQSAQTHLQKTLSITRLHGNTIFQEHLFGLLAGAAIGLNELTQAKEYLQQSMQFEALSDNYRLETLIHYAEYLGRCDRVRQAVSVLQFIHDHPRTGKREVDLTEELLLEFEVKLNTEQLDTAKQQSTSLTLERVVEEALRLTA